MLASVGDQLPRGDDWVFEPKYDGIRILAFVAASDAKLITRNGLDKTRQFPEVVDALRALAGRARRSFVVDGEIVATERGAPARFQRLQARMHVTDREAIRAHRAGAPASFVVFDLLVDGGTTLAAEPWRVRREHLERLMARVARSGSSRALRLSDVSADGRAMLARARRRGWEGIMAKQVDAQYDAGRRSRAWLKLKIEKRQEFVIGGWTEPRKSREHFGAILLGYYDRGGELAYAGHTGTGFTRESLRDLHRRLLRIERKRSPFCAEPRTNERAHWARPAIVVEIKFSEWTADGRLRQPVFIGLRDDKAPREVVHEPDSLTTAPPRHGEVRARPKRVAASVKLARTTARARSVKRGPRTTSPARESASVVAQLDALRAAGGGELQLNGATLEVSSLGKVFFPRTRHTKGDIMRYYARMWPVLHPAVADRPLVMRRFPNGVTGKAFYQQRAPADVPAGVRAEPVSDEGLTTQMRLIGGNLATLLYTVQLGAISVDPWHSRVGSVPWADYAIIDLDPGPRATFARVVEVALAVRDVLDALHLRAIPKTSGATGLHIVLPLAHGVSNDDARAVAQVVATTVAERYPKISTIERTVSRRRGGATYVDYLQNIRGKTVAGVYSVRAQPAPTVSTPLRWSEVSENLDPREFSIDSVPARVASVGDLWAEGMRRRNEPGRLTAHG
jgi:bifunctional non-homologous end joining protein LigD